MPGLRHSSLEDLLEQTSREVAELEEAAAHFAVFFDASCPSELLQRMPRPSVPEPSPCQKGLPTWNCFCLSAVMHSHTPDADEVVGIDRFNETA